MDLIEIAPDDAPLELLLEADPSLQRIQSYLHGSRCFAAKLAAETVGICVVEPKASNVYELMNIAVAAEHQSKGIGSRLLNYAIDTLRSAGARSIELGTGTFGHQLAFYQRAGFRAVSVDRDYFLDHYDAPIFESGIQHKDMLRLQLVFGED